MKKLVFLLASMLFLSATMLAQPELEKGRTVPKKAKTKDMPRFSFGIKAGGSLTSFYTQEFEGALKTSLQGNSRSLSDFTQKALLKPTGGVSLTFNFNKNIAFTPEFLLALMAEENNYKVAFVTGTQSTTIQSINSVTEINYFQVPLLFQFSFGKDLIRPYLKVGGTPAYIIKATRKDVTEQQQTNANGSVTSSTIPGAEQNLVAQSNVTPFQGGATVAAGLHLGRFIDLESRYDFTLSSLSNDAKAFYSGAKSQALGVQLGVKF
jgi:hypothetical protein